MTYLLLACQFLLATVLLVAATGKVLQLEQFTATLRLSHIPTPLAQPLSMIVPVLEGCLAAGLLLGTPQSLPVVMIATTSLLVLFTGWMIGVYMRGLHLACYCFGADSAEVGLRTMVRNGLLIVLSSLGTFLARRTASPLPSPSLWMIVTVSALAMCVALIVSFQQGFPALVLSQGKRLEQEASSMGEREVVT